MRAESESERERESEGERENDASGTPWCLALYQLSVNVDWGTKI